jgi:hypothetical protein
MLSGRFIMDRGHIDFERLHRFNRRSGVLRDAHEERDSVPTAGAAIGGLHHCPAIGSHGRRPPRRDAHIQGPLRGVRYVDRTTTKRLTFLTNSFTVPALAIPQLYKSGWQSERLACRDNAHFLLLFSISVPNSTSSRTANNCN